jgi:hypothetical protein
MKPLTENPLQKTPYKKPRRRVIPLLWKKPKKWGRKRGNEEEARDKMQMSL